MKSDYAVFVWIDDRSSGYMAFTHPSKNLSAAKKEYNAAIRFAKQMELIYRIELVEYPRVGDRTQIIIESQRSQNMNMIYLIYSWSEGDENGNNQEKEICGFKKTEEEAKKYCDENWRCFWEYCSEIE